ncbi:MAG: RNA polymerase factor sigma-54 [Candidatus Margulisbacteria bacterium]|nr:RNA polymerase factor sigma-54 [Candidatus Margulisiibacteriota bacterium]MBU1021160.1 RNA polymerase factor sigma-54 [Candidatus Margulisiibacteriota bacterium]MBU1729766.1 RNA polymerase factor sigma-54 [Candidatus Margulisiibacteriota bacterium]MBU1955267.1 RNA polymerase factor sigma-54 [Candidatus Margulisiibacteriota bacterium]
MDLNVSQHIDQRLEQTLELTLAPRMLAMLKLLNLPYQDLLEKIKQESEENVMLEVEHQDEYVGLINYIGSHPSQKKQLDFKDLPGIENIGDEHQTLEKYLLTQLDFEKLSEPNHQIAEALISSINPDGYLLHYPEVREKIEKDFNVSRPTVDKILKIIQTFEPDGVGARDLKECLLIQLREHNFQNDQLETIVETIIQKHLEALAEGHFQKIAESLSIREAGVKQVAEFIKNNLNPKPGSIFAEAERHLVPSFAYEEDEHGKPFVLNLEEKYGPTLKISPQYEKILKETKDEETIKYLKEKMERAKELVEGVKKRQETQNKIAAYIVKHQIAFFKKGENWVRPLLQKEIAQEVDVHPSTVSRALAAKYIQTQKGLYHLKNLCQRSWMGISKRKMKELIEEIIQIESQDHPISDEKIKNQLQERGIKVSRRAVADYRKQLNIPAAKERQTA